MAALSPAGVVPVGFSITDTRPVLEAISLAISSVRSDDGATATTTSSDPS